MVEKGPGIIDDYTRATLKAAACNLHLQRIDRMVITSVVCGGIIQTNWDSHNVGGRSGILFSCQVERDEGDFFVNFLLNTSDLEAGAEIIREMEEKGFERWDTSQERFPVPELYKFRDLRRQSLH
ncbi:hypothetical protein A2592_02715 [Candidatus Kaiserbacteria bacterium RIFOXYD1_FULL_42_15]|uniref:Uncharacterized protein n=1 Tax=Candidatus Kaiserbacteria bacterium RIFOXYD1_FULL_42_15 TaxID=1798532 RepID=A0A1F6FSB5_9BACT|nr:MAG: hypothetical protein A2592_02715 [Candidatus Kaiserbacteria bacterium RIFOXYD1_FULL_42_15]